MNNKYEVGLFIIRVVLGLTFFIHGLSKFQGGIENTVGWFDSIGLPGFLAYAVAVLELAGGILIILGLFSRVVAALQALLMVGAILKVKLAIGFLGNGQMAGYELDLSLLSMSAFIVITGSKLLSLDAVFFKENKEETVSL